MRRGGGVAKPRVKPTRAHAARALPPSARRRYPPVGSRSFGPVRASLLAPGGGYCAEANAAVGCWAMIETAAALSCAGEIAAVEGVEGLFIGPNDLSLALGVPPSSSPTDPRVLASARAACAPRRPRSSPRRAAPHARARFPRGALAAGIERIRDAAHGKGKKAGIFCGDGASAGRMAALGFDFVIAGTDTGLLQAAAAKELQLARASPSGPGAAKPAY